MSTLPSTFCRVFAQTHYAIDTTAGQVGQPSQVIRVLFSSATPNSVLSGWSYLGLLFSDYSLT